MGGIRFTTLTLKNFLSYGNSPTIIDLSCSGTTLILGEDLDDAGTGSNGVGKTVLINALTYALYDKPISDISKDDLVNNINKKFMEVTIEFEKGGNTYFIRRVRKEKAGAAGNYVQVFKNGRGPEHDITLDSVAHANAQIIEILGLPYELFVRIVAFSATLMPFLDLPVRHPQQANQTDIIEELFNFKMLSEKATVLKDKIKITNQKIKSAMERIGLLEGEHDRHKKQIVSAEERFARWIVSNEGEIATIEKMLNKIKDIDFETERALHASFDDVEKKLKTAKYDASDIAHTIEDLESKSSKIEEELEHLVDAKCPYCLQDYKNAQNKIKEKKQCLATFVKDLSDLGTIFEEAHNGVQVLTTERDEIKSKITVNNLDELIEIKSKSDYYIARLEELEIAENPHTESLDELLAIELDDINYTELDDLKEHSEHEKFLLKLLTDKDSFVRRVLLNKNIPFLNKRVMHYLSDLGLPHTVEFTHQMTAKISQFDRPMSFGQLSNGQRARINLALAFAFRDVLESMHEKINVCMLDEVLDVGLNSSGVANAARMLKRKARDEGLSLFIITHRDEIDSAFDRTMTVQMSKGFSYIKEAA